MEIQTRHRIIGIAVIIALILIFVPLLVSKRLNQPQMVAPGIPTPPLAPQVQNPVGVQNSTDQTTISPATSGADQMPLVTSASGINQTQPVTSVPGVDQTQTATTSGNGQIPALTPTPIKQCSPEDGNCDVNIPSSDADSQSMSNNPQSSDQDVTLPSTDQSATLNGTNDNAPIVQQPISNDNSSSMNNNPQPSDQSGMNYQDQNTTQPTDQPATLNGTDNNPPVAQQPSLQPAPVTPPAAVKPVKLQEDNTAEKMTYAVLGKKTVAKTKTVMHKQPIAHTKVNTVGWVIQIGYFSSEKNANHIIQQLQKKGFTAFGYKAQTANGNAGVHVYIGPSADYAKAKSVQARLARYMNMKGYVTQFDASAMN